MASMGQSGSCDACPSGFYNLQNGMSSCNACPAGYQCINTTSTPRICPKGYYSRNASTQCEQCGAGTYSATAGSSSCTVCSAGSACPLGASGT
jgi:hypothetical protein